MPLTSEDIETLANTSAKLFLPLFDADLPLIVDPDHEEEETPFVTAEMTERLNKLRSLPHQRFSELVGLLAQDCRQQSESSSYPGVSYDVDDNTAAANFRHFGLSDDGLPPADWYKPSWFRHIYLTENYKGASARLQFRPPWEQEHGTQFVLIQDQFQVFQP